MVRVQRSQDDLLARLLPVHARHDREGLSPSRTPAPQAASAIPQSTPADTHTSSALLRAPAAVVRAVLRCLPVHEVAGLRRCAHAARHAADGALAHLTDLPATGAPPAQLPKLLAGAAGSLRRVGLPDLPRAERSEALGALSALQELAVEAWALPDAADILGALRPAVRAGLLRRLDLRTADCRSAALPALLAECAELRWLRVLSLAPDADVDMAWPPKLEHFDGGDWRPPAPAVARLARALPRLHTLRLNNCLALEDADVAAVAAACPALHTLGLRRALRLTGAGLPASLRELAIDGRNVTDLAVLPPRLRVLSLDALHAPDVRAGRLPDGLEELQWAAPLLSDVLPRLPARLRSLQLALDVRVSEEEARALAARCPLLVRAGLEPLITGAGREVLQRAGVRVFR